MVTFVVIWRRSVFGGFWRFQNTPAPGYLQENHVLHALAATQVQKKHAGNDACFYDMFNGVY